MKTEEAIKLNLNSLCVYKGIFEDEIGDKFKRLVDKICINDSLGENLRAYNEFVYSLFSFNE